jgi:hypothetical protein
MIIAIYKYRERNGAYKMMKKESTFLGVLLAAGG